MNWFKIANNNIFTEKVKAILKSHHFTQTLAGYYHVPLSDIDAHLQIEVCDLDGKFAEGNGKLIRIDKKLLDKNFFRDNFHFVIHEFFHWLKRRSEEQFYFNDPEEVQSFVLQMTWELIQGKSKKDMVTTIYPIIQAHFKNNERFREIFREMVSRAVDLYMIYKSKGEFNI